MNCYFCHKKLNKTDPDVFSSHDCPDCQEKYQLKNVTSTYNKDHTALQYAHIYHVTADYEIAKMDVLKNNARKFSRHSTDDVNVQIGKKYHIRLNLEFNTTDISDSHLSGSNHIVTLPGFPINPANIKEKLSLYLLFT